VLARRFGVQLSEGTRDLLVFSKASGPSLGPTQSASGLKRLDSEADYSLPSSGELNEWSYASFPPVYRQCVGREDFTSYLYVLYVAFYECVSWSVSVKEEHRQITGCRGECSDLKGRK